MSDPLADAIREMVRAEVRAEMAAQRDRPTPPRLLSVPDACAALGGMSRARFYQLIARGEVRTVSIGRRRLVPEGALAELIAQAGQ